MRLLRRQYMPSTRSLSSPGVVCQEAFSSAETLSPPKILHIHGGILPLRMVQCLQTDTEKEYLFLTNNSGYTPPRDVEHLRLPPRHRAGRCGRHSGAGPERKALNRPPKGPQKAHKRPASQWEAGLLPFISSSAAAMRSRPDSAAPSRRTARYPRRRCRKPSQAPTPPTAALWG